jgi:hypothetical protein
MTTTNHVTPNGRIRKNLADQIDRLDGILDGLADALNEAVAAAVKNAVTLALQEALQGLVAEVLSNPDMLAKLRGLLSTTIPDPHVAPAVPVAATPSTNTRTGKVGAWLGRGWRGVHQACASVAGGVAHLLSAARRRWQTVRPFRLPLLLALGAGVAVGALAFWGGPYIAALVGWVAGFTSTIAAQAGIWLRRLYATWESPTTSPATDW